MGQLSQLDQWDETQQYTSSSLDSLKGGYIGDYIGDCYSGY